MKKAKYGKFDIKNTIDITITLTCDM